MKHSVKISILIVAMLVLCLWFAQWKLSPSRIREDSHKVPLIDQIYQTTVSATSEITLSTTTDTNSSEIPFRERGRINTQGYWLVMHYSDQGTGAFQNILSMLCLSKTVGNISVVEPFMFESTPGIDTSAKWTEQVRFSSVFDKDEFNRCVQTKHYNSLVSYKTFIENAPNKLLIAQYKCTGYIVCRTCRHNDILERGRSFAKLNGLIMVDVVCLDYGPKGMMNVNEFERQLYSKYKKSEVVVLFPIFAGVSPGRSTQSVGYLLNLTPSSCWRNNYKESFNYLKPSTDVSISADNFIKTYLGNNQYISVMVRIELILRGKFNSEDAKTCFTRLENRINLAKSQFGIEEVILLLDIGMYGSTFFRELFVEHYWAILSEVNRFISRAMKKGMDLANLDEMFSNTTKIRNPGFVAVMQKVIAANSNVLILLGGGNGMYRSSYQETTENMYNERHSKRNVIMVGNSCE